MGYDIFSFYSLIEEIPKLDIGTNGEKYLKICYENESNRLPIESFIGMKFESTITKVSSKSLEYLRLYTEYKSIAPLLQKAFENSLNTTTKLS